MASARDGVKVPTWGAVEVSSDRRFELSAEPAEVWTSISRVDQYRRWWPWLLRFEARGLVTGDAWRCVVQPPLPYAVRFTVELDEVVAPGHVTARIVGDVCGTARLDLVSTAGGCEARLRSTLTPTTRLLALAAVIAPPVVRFGHDWVLDAGLRQFLQRGF